MAMPTDFDQRIRAELISLPTPVPRPVLAAPFALPPDDPDPGQATQVCTAQFRYNDPWRIRILTVENGYARDYRWDSGNGHQVILCPDDANTMRRHLLIGHLTDRHGLLEFRLLWGVVSPRFPGDPDQPDPDDPARRRRDGQPRAYLARPELEASADAGTFPRLVLRPVTEDES